MTFKFRTHIDPVRVLCENFVEICMQRLELGQSIGEALPVSKLVYHVNGGAGMMLKYSFAVNFLRTKSVGFQKVFYSRFLFLQQ